MPGRTRCGLQGGRRRLSGQALPRRGAGDAAARARAPRRGPCRERDPVRLDRFDAQTGQFELDGLPLKLTAFEWRVLSCLMLRKEVVVERLDLLERVYEGDADVDSNSLEVIVGRLRRKIGAERIETVRGRGYRLTGGAAMRLLPRSLSGRLLVTAAWRSLVALGFAALTIGACARTLRDARARRPARRADRGGRARGRARRPIDAARAIDVPPFDLAGSGWAWEVTARAARCARARSARPTSWPRHRAARTRLRTTARRDRAASVRRRTIARGERIHGRLLTLATPRGDVRILAPGRARWSSGRCARRWRRCCCRCSLLGLALAVAILIAAADRAAAAQVADARRSPRCARRRASMSQRPSRPSCCRWSPSSTR